MFRRLMASYLLLYNLTCYKHVNFRFVREMRNLPFCDATGCSIPKRNKYTNVFSTTIFDDKHEAAFTTADDDVKCR